MKAQRSNSRSEVLLQASAELFADQGFIATSMRDIAKAVGMLPGSIYYHFPSKDDLLLAIYRAGVHQITLTFEAAIEPHADPWARLEAGVSALIHAVSSESSYTRVIFKVTPEDVPRYRNELVTLRDAFEEKFAGLVDNLPLKPGIDRHLLKLMLLGAGNHAQLWFSPEGERTAEEIGQHFCNLVKDAAAVDPDA